MFEVMHTLLDTVLSTALDVAPIVVILVLFQVVVLRQRLPNLRRIAAGAVLVLLGLTLILIGLQEALFPIGETMARQLTAAETVGAERLADGVHWHDYLLVYAFAAAIGFATTVAEPSLIAVALKAEEVSGGTVHAWGLRIAVAIGVAVGVALGCFRIVTGTPLPWYIIAAYIVVIVQTSGPVGPSCRSPTTAAVSRPRRSRCRWSRRWAWVWQRAFRAGARLSTDSDSSLSPASFQSFPCWATPSPRPG